MTLVGDLLVDEKCGLDSRSGQSVVTGICEFDDENVAFIKGLIILHHLDDYYISK
jgi:hypothetical protein